MKEWDTGEMAVQHSDSPHCDTRDNYPVLYLNKATITSMFLIFIMNPVSWTDAV